jgi:hypothetical protein
VIMAPCGMSLPLEAQPARPPSTFKLQGGTRTQVFNPDLFAALDRLQKGIRGGGAAYLGSG